LKLPRSPLRKNQILRCGDTPGSTGSMRIRTGTRMDAGRFTLCHAWMVQSRIVP
jgi:hypothetical protein